MSPDSPPDFVASELKVEELLKPSALRVHLSSAALTRQTGR